MLKLYKMDEKPPRYWETWDNDDGSHTVHWGVLGQTGETKTVKSSLPKKATDKIQSEIDDLVSQGYRPIDLDDHSVLLIEYAVDGLGDSDDLDKRHKLESKMNETLGWTGLGHCDGGSVGSDTMEVCCFVVDFSIAKAVIEADLKGSEFKNYTRIYDERAE
ncbi:MAG: hypothetical protein AAFV47_11025 [Pseudomonadota bacterium]